MAAAWRGVWRVVDIEYGVVVVKDCAVFGSDSTSCSASKRDDVVRNIILLQINAKAML